MSGSPVDPTTVRKILLAAGAPAQDMDALVDACRTLDDARGYRRQPRQAWCVRCDGVTASDDAGCLECREGGAR